MIRLVTFDALHTLITPRLPIYTQYSQVFAPYLGELPPPALARSFKAALKQIQAEQPVYKNGPTEWWGEVIRRTATGAGADPHVVDRSLDEIVPRLMKRFSSAEGYKLFDDSLDTVKALKQMNVQAGLVTNADSRILSAMNDLGILQYLSPILVSEGEGVEKPSAEIFHRACARAGVALSEALHVGDELDADYHGARKAGLQALLLRRPDPEGEGERKEDGEDLTGVRVIPGLKDVLDVVKRTE